MKKVCRMVAVSLLAVLIVFSVVYNVCTKKFTERSLFFVEPVSGAVVLEHRLIAEKHDLEKNLELLVADELLGPSLLVLDGVFPRDTLLNHILLRDAVLYVDLSIEAAFAGTDGTLALKDSLKILERTVKFNFRGIENIVITIGGSVPDLI